MNTKARHALKRLTLIAAMASPVFLSACVVAPAYPARVRGDVVVGVAPLPGMIWFDGYWGYGPSGRYWRPGHWGRR